VKLGYAEIKFDVDGEVQYIPLISDDWEYTLCSTPAPNQGVGPDNRKHNNAKRKRSVDLLTDAAPMDLSSATFSASLSCKGIWNGILFEVGTRLHVQHVTFNDNDWYPALVTKVNPGSRTVNIHFSGWDTKYDLISISMDDKCINLPPRPSKNRDTIRIGGVLGDPHLVKKGDIIRAQDLVYPYKWHDVSVLDIDISKQQVYVTFHGWSHKYDEWIPAISKRLNYLDNNPNKSTRTENVAGGLVRAAAKEGEPSDWWARGNSFMLGAGETRTRKPAQRSYDPGADALRFGTKAKSNVIHKPAVIPSAEMQTKIVYNSPTTTLPDGMISMGSCKCRKKKCNTCGGCKGIHCGCKAKAARKSAPTPPVEMASIKPCKCHKKKCSVCGKCNGVHCTCKTTAVRMFATTKTTTPVVTLALPTVPRKANMCATPGCTTKPLATHSFCNTHRTCDVIDDVCFTATTAPSADGD
jgi:hypothetical protein